MIDSSLLLKPASRILESSRRDLVYFLYPSSIRTHMSTNCLRYSVPNSSTSTPQTQPSQLPPMQPLPQPSQLPLSHPQPVGAPTSTATVVCPKCNVPHLFVTTTPIMPSCPANCDLVLRSMLAWHTPTHWKAQRHTWKRSRNSTPPYRCTVYHWQGSRSRASTPVRSTGSHAFNWLHIGILSHASKPKRVRPMGSTKCVVRC